MFENIDKKLKDLVECEEMMNDEELKSIAIEERTRLIEEIN